ncbi:hypothetical protein [Amantichitinum ursilacus]|uniref:Uncharacterized protein n=1 Tax=Amantichitinum ursilacus TaxID=857265 RepID=A0A0N0XJP0_9NEIS|nr:hypothetical protein [Amantichitinum ursilacus]KPC53849.1 hypothetical protein WG78_06990 [Amantichitinum ursilacus]
MILAARSICLAVVLIGAQPAIASDNPSWLNKQMTFKQARRAILRAGWQPIRSDDRDHDYGVVSALHHKGVKEITQCSEGESFCNFYYRKQNECLRLITIGEQLPALKVYDWTSECPDE